MSEVEFSATKIFPQYVFCRRDPNAPWTTPEFKKQCLSLQYRKNGSNWASSETYVLDLPEFKQLKDTIQVTLDSILEDQYQVDTKKTQLYITQSWLIVNESGDSHSQHQHPNSMFSGVVYINAGDPDGLTFLDARFNTRISFESRCYSKADIPVKSGDILIFDSQIQHLVAATERKQKRISLAFNTIVKGTIGSPYELTEVKI